MVEMLILTALLLTPIVFLVLFRANAALGFLSLCLGSVLVSYGAADAGDFAASFSPGNTLAIDQIVRIMLLTLPLFLTLLFTHHNIYGRKRFSNMLCAIICGLFYALLLVPLLSRGFQQAVEAQEIWQQLSNLQTAVIFSGAILSMSIMFASHKPHKEDKKSGSKH